MISRRHDPVNSVGDARDVGVSDALVRIYLSTLRMLDAALTVYAYSSCAPITSRTRSQLHFTPSRSRTCTLDYLSPVQYRRVRTSPPCTTETRAVRIQAATFLTRFARRCRRSLSTHMSSTRPVQDRTYGLGSRALGVLYCACSSSGDGIERGGHWVKTQMFEI